MRLAGRVALITGASRGIGRAIAMELAREGVDVAVNYRKQAAAAEETAAEIRALGRRAVVVQADISDAAACLRMAGAAEAALGPLDVVVANGASPRDRPSSPTCRSRNGIACWPPISTDASTRSRR